MATDLWPYVLDTWVKRASMLSTDYHLVMVNCIRWRGKMLARHGILKVYWASIGDIWQRPQSSRSSIPSSDKTSIAFWGRVGTVSLSGPCSASVLLRQLQNAVTARALVPVVAVIPEPEVQGSYQVEKEVLSCLVSLWDSRSSWQTSR